MEEANEPAGGGKGASARVEARRDFLKTVLAGFAVGAGGWVAASVNTTALGRGARGTDRPADKSFTPDEYNELFRRKFKRCIEVGFHYHDLGQYDGYYSEILSKFDAKEIVANLVRANADSCHFWAEAISDYYYDANGSQLQL